MNKIDHALIAKLEKQLEELLKERPELVMLQKRVELLLTRAGDNQHNRCTAIQEMMLEIWSGIIPAGKALEEAWNGIKKDPE